MRWSIVRLICNRELRDQLRDRRTLFMIAVLPVLIYPVAGLGFMELATRFLKTAHHIGVVNGGQLIAEESPRSAAAWLSFLPPSPGCALDAPGRAAAALALSQAPGIEFPPLLSRGPRQISFFPAYLDRPDDFESMIVSLDDASVVGPTESDASTTGPASHIETVGGLRIDRSRLDGRQIDLLLVFEPDFIAKVQRGDRPAIHVLMREGDDRSRLVNTRVGQILNRWKRGLKEVRLLRSGLPADFDEAFEVRDPDKAKPVATRAAEELFDVLVRLFPFVLVMWALAGALYPAVDLCAGEKERGTMETLLISPASREEIVWGKFLTIWIFSAATALLNLLSMGLTIWQFTSSLAVGSFRPGVLLWAVVLLLPLSAFFSALCLAVGAYARSNKEGQYYLMPLFLITMPLIFLTLAPGVELNAFYSMVPVTGVALLLQKLMVAVTPDRQLWLYFIPVLAPMVIYGWLALRWAIEQFQREEVLFREAERLDLKLWLKRLFREKEPLPNAGEALLCFALVLGLTWVARSFGNRLAPWVQLVVLYLAIVPTPAVFMALLITTRPRLGLGLLWPARWTWGVAFALAALLCLPGAEISYFTMKTLDLSASLRESQMLPLGSEGSAGAVRQPLPLALLALVGVSLLTAFMDELVFRGFILTGLRRRFQPWTAVFLSSFLFALFQMNVFQFIPHFVLGVVMGAFVVRSGSVLPAMAFHWAYNCFTFGLLVLLPSYFPEAFAALTYDEPVDAPFAVLRAAVSLGCAVGAIALLAATVFPRRAKISQVVTPSAPEPAPLTMAVATSDVAR